MIRRLAALALSVTTIATAHAGPLTPPAGAPAPTNKTLNEVEPRIPLTQDTAPGSGFVVFNILQPGSYYLTGDVQAINLAGFGITIGVSDVTIDLNGYTIRGGTSPSDGIFLNGPSISNIHIHNGTISGFNNALNFGPTSNGGSLTNLTIEDCLDFGARLGTDFAVHNCLVRNNGGAGVSAGARAIVTDSTFAGNGGTGLSCSAGSVVSRCISENGGFNGFFIRAGSISECYANDNTNAGFQFDDACTVTDCVAAFNDFDGFDGRAAGGTIYENCIAEGNSFVGFYAYSSVVRGCMALKNTDDGFRSGDTDRESSVFESCHALQNGGSGFNGQFGTNLYTGCVANNNSAAGFSSVSSHMHGCFAYDNFVGFTGSSSTVVSSVAWGNRNDGISCFGGSAIHCTAISNDANGFDDMKFIAGCVARSNEQHGVNLGSGALMRDTFCTENGAGGVIYAGVNLVGDGNVVRDCSFIANANAGIRIQNTGMDNLIIRNTLHDDTIADFGSGNTIGGGALTDPSANIIH